MNALFDNMPFNELKQELEKSRKEYEKCIEITEKRIIENEQKKELLRSVGLLDD